MKIWIDDVRPAPVGYIRCRTVNQAKCLIQAAICWATNKFDLAQISLYNAREQGVNIEIPDIADLPKMNLHIELIDIDHDAGIYAKQGGDYIKILDWMEERGISYPIHIHSMNLVGRNRMIDIAKRNKWILIK